TVQRHRDIVCQRLRGGLLAGGRAGGLRTVSFDYNVIIEAGDGERICIVAAVVLGTADSENHGATVVVSIAIRARAGIEKVDACDVNSRVANGEISDEKRTGGRSVANAVD